MAIPGFQSLMLPVLRLASKGETTLKACIAPLAAEFGVTADELEEMLPSRRAKRFYNRVAWAKTHIAQAGLVAPTRYGVFQATDRGRQVLLAPPERIDMAFLMRYAEYARFRGGDDGGGGGGGGGGGDGTPDERICAAVEEVESTLQAEVLAAVIHAGADFLQDVTLELMRRMKYGGPRPDGGRVVGGPGDGGVDVVLDEDALGLGVVCVQCKCYAVERSIDVKEVTAFAGALDSRGAKKGVFVTTSRFTEPARRFVDRLGEKKIVLIDGERLAAKLVEHDLGVQTSRRIDLKRIDRDFFESEDGVD